MHALGDIYWTDEQMATIATLPENVALRVEGKDAKYIRLLRGLAANVYVTCGSCAQKVRASYIANTDNMVCTACWDAAGLENEHEDYGHPERVADCPTCAL
jgi:hypothetical protein